MKKIVFCILLFPCIRTHGQTLQPLDGPYKNCDNTISGTPINGNMRMATACEIQFDSFIRKSITASLNKVRDHFVQKGWQLVPGDQTVIVNAVQLGSEHEFYDPGRSNAPYIQLRMHLESNEWNDLYREQFKKWQAAKGDAAPAAKKDLDSLQRLMDEATNIWIFVYVNELSPMLPNTPPVHSIEKPAGAAFFLHLKRLGGFSALSNWSRSVILLGKWKEPQVDPPASGNNKEIIKCATLANKNDSRFSVQALNVTIFSNDQLATETLNNIDLGGLNKLLAH